MKNKSFVSAFAAVFMLTPLLAQATPIQTDVQWTLKAFNRTTGRFASQSTFCITSANRVYDANASSQREGRFVQEGNEVVMMFQRVDLTRHSALQCRVINSTSMSCIHATHQQPQDTSNQISNLDVYMTQLTTEGTACSN